MDEIPGLITEKPKSFRAYLDGRWETVKIDGYSRDMRKVYVLRCHPGGSWRRHSVPVTTDTLIEWGSETRDSRPLHVMKQEEPVRTKRQRRVRR